MNELEFKSLVPLFHEFQECPIRKRSTILGWHISAVDQFGESLGGGTHETKETAQRIAIAEAVERAFFQKIFFSEDCREFECDSYPSTCGFAAGFSQERTKFRAICEAYERWIWEQWIDHNFFVSEIPRNHLLLTDLQQELLKNFNDVKFFKTTVEPFHPAHGSLTLDFAVVLGITEQGIFPGSRVSSPQDDLWSHGIVEAVRHWGIAQDLQQKDSAKHNLIDRRILHFSKEKDQALSQIRKAINKQWPIPSLKFVKEYKTSSSVYLWRALCNDFRGWHQGDETRFIY